MKYERYDIQFSILQICGEEYSFQNILVCKDFLNIIKQLKYDTKIILSNNISDKIFYEGLNYFLFIIDHIKINELHEHSDLLLYMMENIIYHCNIDIFNLIIKYKLDEIKNSLYFNNIIMDRRAELSNDLIDKVENSNLNMIEIDKKLYNDIKKLKKMYDILFY